MITLPTTRARLITFCARKRCVHPPGNYRGSARGSVRHSRCEDCTRLVPSHYDTRAHHPHPAHPTTATATRAPFTPLLAPHTHSQSDEHTATEHTHLTHVTTTLKTSTQHTTHKHNRISQKTIINQHKYPKIDNVANHQLYLDMYQASTPEKRKP